MSAKTVKDPLKEKVHKNVRIVKEQQKFGCKKHGTEHLMDDLTTGDRICTRCALVVEERMVCDEAEWRNFEGDTQAEKWAKSRVGDTENPFLSDDFNLGTSIKIMDKSQNKSISFGGNIMNQYKRRSVDNALSNAFKEIDTIGSRISLPPSVLLKAKTYYSKLYREKKFKGNILLIDTKTAACVYLACSMDGCPRSSKEIAGIYECSANNVKAAVYRAQKILDLKLPKERGVDMIDRFAYYMGMSRNERNKARKISNDIQERQPNTKYTTDIIAGVSIYLATISSRGLYIFF